MSNKIRVLIIDDANFMVKSLRQLLSEDDAIEVVGSARNGEEGLVKILELRPDVVTLDVDMPVMDGLSTLRNIMIRSPLPVVMLSSMFEYGDITFEAVRLGVVDFLPKPSGASSKDIRQAKNEIIDRVKLAASQNVSNVRRVRLPSQEAIQQASKTYAYRTLEYVVIIGTTLGGPNAVINLLMELDSTLPVSIVVMQELSSDLLPAFVKKFAEFTSWHVEVAMPDVVLEQGVCYFSSYQAPVTIMQNVYDEVVISPGLNDGESLNNLYASAAPVLGDSLIAILLSGVGSDGQEGFAEVKAYGGHTIAQETETCVYPNLTDHAIGHGVVDDVVKLSQLVSHVQQLIEHKMAKSEVF